MNERTDYESEEGNEVYLTSDKPTIDGVIGVCEPKTDRNVGQQRDEHLRENSSVKSSKTLLKERRGMFGNRVVEYCHS